jgi:hypothetical protein
MLQGNPSYAAALNASEIVYASITTQNGWSGNFSWWVDVWIDAKPRSTKFLVPTPSCATCTIPAVINVTGTGLDRYASAEAGASPIRIIQLSSTLLSFIVDISPRNGTPDVKITFYVGGTYVTRPVFVGTAVEWSSIEFPYQNYTILLGASFPLGIEFTVAKNLNGINLTSLDFALSPSLDGGPTYRCVGDRLTRNPVTGEVKCRVDDPLWVQQLMTTNAGAIYSIAQLPDYGAGVVAPYYYYGYYIFYGQYYTPWLSTVSQVPVSLFWPSVPAFGAVSAVPIVHNDTKLLTSVCKNIFTDPFGNASAIMESGATPGVQFGAQISLSPNGTACSIELAQFPPVGNLSIVSISARGATYNFTPSSLVASIIFPRSFRFYLQGAFPPEDSHMRSIEESLARLWNLPPGSISISYQPPIFGSRRRSEVLDFEMIARFLNPQAIIIFGRLDAGDTSVVRQFAVTVASASGMPYLPQPGAPTLSNAPSAVSVAPSTSSAAPVQQNTPTADAAPSDSNLGDNVPSPSNGISVAVAVIIAVISTALVLALVFIIVLLVVIRNRQPRERQTSSNEAEMVPQAASQTEQPPSQSIGASPKVEHEKKKEHRKSSRAKQSREAEEPAEASKIQEEKSSRKHRSKKREKAVADETERVFVSESEEVSAPPKPPKRRRRDPTPENSSEASRSPSPPPSSSSSSDDSSSSQEPSTSSASSISSSDDSSEETD